MGDSHDPDPDADWPITQYESLTLHQASLTLEPGFPLDPRVCSGLENYSVYFQFDIALIWKRTLKPLNDLTPLKSKHYLQSCGVFTPLMYSRKRSIACVD